MVIWSFAQRLFKTRREPNLSSPLPPLPLLQPHQPVSWLAGWLAAIVLREQRAPSNDQLVLLGCPIGRLDRPIGPINKCRPSWRAELD